MSEIFLIFVLEHIMSEFFACVTFVAYFRLVHFLTLLFTMLVFCSENFTALFLASILCDY